MCSVLRYRFLCILMLKRHVRCWCSIGMMHAGQHQAVVRVGHGHAAGRVARADHRRGDRGLQPVKLRTEAACGKLWTRLQRLLITTQS